MSSGSSGRAAPVDASFVGLFCAQLQVLRALNSIFVFVWSRDESEVYLSGLGTVGMEIFEQVPRVDAVVVPAAGQYGLLAATAAAIKHLNPQITVIVSVHTWRCKSPLEALLPSLQMFVHLLLPKIPDRCVLLE